MMDKHMPGDNNGRAQPLDMALEASAEVAIVGAGPIGLELAACLKRRNVNYLHFEARQIGHTISWWPRNTYFFSTTERIEIAGIPIQNTAQQRTIGEEYLAYLRSVVEQLDLEVRTYEPVVEIQRPRGGSEAREGHVPQEGFLLTTNPPTGPMRYACRKLVLATGDMHRPNWLNIPGEDLPHVSHYFLDVHAYFRRNLLIVGGRNSAAEAALRCWRAGARVTLSYRQASFNPRVVKHWILPDLETQVELGNIQLHPRTVPVEITPGHVILEELPMDDASHEACQQRRRIVQPADFVLLLTGYRADMRLFEMASVTLLGDNRAPKHDPDTMETDVPGLYVAGTAAAGERQERYSLFIENTHVHVGRIVKALTGSWPEKLGTVSARHYDLPLEAIEAN